MRILLKKLRVKKGFTHESIANLLHISRTTYTNIELGNKNPSLNLAMKMKSTLNYEKDDIFLNF